MGNLYGLLGHPVAHSMSAAMHNDQFQQLGLPHHYQAFDVCPTQLKEAVQAIRTLGIAGFNVTVPHKVEVMKHLDVIDEEAKRIGAVNTVVNNEGTLIGYNTDGQGYLDSLLEVTGEELKNFRVLIIGAGGAARAVVAALSRFGVKELVIANRTIEKAERLAIETASNTKINACMIAEAERKAHLFDVFINCTSVGMHNTVDDVPLPVANIPKTAICSDLIYNPRKTRWLTEAEKRGITIHNGIGMLVRQGALAFEKWLGQKPDIERMTDVLLERLK